VNCLNLGFSQFSSGKTGKAGKICLEPI